MEKLAKKLDGLSITCEITDLLLPSPVLPVTAHHITIILVIIRKRPENPADPILGKGSVNEHGIR